MLGGILDRDRETREADSTCRAPFAELIHHQESVEAALSVDGVYQFFQTHPHEYAAVVSDGAVVGMCGRSHVGGLLAGRYGFALHSRAPIGHHLIANSVTVSIETPLADVLEIALTRVGAALFDDVVMADDAGALVGLIPTRSLVEAQSAIVQQQLAALDAQRGALASANARLAASLEQQRLVERQMIEREKAALIETLSGGVAHELNNKLMPIVGYTELLLEELKGLGVKGLEDYCRTIHQSALEASRIIRQLLQLSRPLRSQRLPFDLRDVVEQSALFIELRCREAGVRIDVALPRRAVTADGDAGQIKQVLLNLLLNALQAVAAVERPVIQIQLDADADTAVITVSDNGPGIAPDVMPRIFDPFFTTKEPDIGTGLGLSVCRAIITQHEGSLSAASDGPRGAVFTAVLPLAKTGALHRQDARLPPPPARCAGCRVLVVDDQPAIAALVARTIRTKLEGAVDIVDNGADARTAITERDYDLILSDIRMPHMNGAQLMAWIRQERPELRSRVLLMTGDASSSALNTEVERAGYPILQKPFTANQLVSMIHNVLERAGHSAEAPHG